MGWFRRRQKGTNDKGPGLDLTELGRRLDMRPEALAAFEPGYHTFRIPKRKGGMRVIMAPDDETKELQRRLLHRLLAKLAVHEAALGFEAGRSVVHHAARHARQAVIVKMDILDFFPSTREERLRAYFGGIGWNSEAAAVLTRLTTAEGGLPQGAPTSPRLSNLVNVQMDEKLEALASANAIRYSRYADDMVFSWEVDDERELVGGLKFFAPKILAGYGYKLNPRKTHVLRAHQRQTICGLVVNQGVALPRATRRWLRAVEHRTFMGGKPSLNARQLAGWAAYREMIIDQAAEQKKYW